MAEYWFKPKRYGYGATPATWQGWALTLGTVLAIVAVSLYLRFTGHSPRALLALLIFDAAAVSTLIIISYRKTEGAWRWRWGDR